MSLDRWVTTEPRRDEIWHTVLAAGRGLAAAHRAGLVHRDFKPHNVLRSDDGRVLVTDFGLARGHGDDAGAAVGLEVTQPAGSALALETTLEATPSRGSLDAPLTQTGALLGTPAYMAPEQFLGAAPDPRTDQFAYCVTAWQLLVGERPFRGTTIEELRRAASAGVAGRKVKLPAAIRAVLVRGLDPDPRRRWPEMASLLAALERARSQPQRRRRLGFAIAVAALGVALVGKLAHDGKARDSVCEIAPEDEAARAWSPEQRAALAQQFAASPSFRYVAGELDGFSARWLSDYRGACTNPRSTRTFAKLGCLLGERDEVSGITALIPAIAPADLERVEMGGVLPRPQACDGDAPVPPPTLPDDPGKRAEIEALRPKLLAARFATPETILAAMPALVAQAQVTGWDPVIAEAHQAFAIAARRAGWRWELARDHFKIANELARRSHHYHLEADTWANGLLIGEIEAASDPADPSEVAELFAQARVAVHNAGDDPVYVARILEVEGFVAMSRGRLDEAFATYDRARAIELAERDWGTATRCAVDAASVLITRNRPADLTGAWTLLIDAERATASVRVPDDARADLARALALVAALRGDLAAAHAWADREPPRKPPPGAVEISGRVVDSTGRGVAGASVVAWRGALDGDATRAYAHRGFDGAVATSAPDGGFMLRGYRDGGILAELGDRRSQPRVVGDGAVAVTLEVTRAVAGTVTGDGELAPGIMVMANYQLGHDLAWRCASFVGASHDYRLAGLPSGEATLRLDAKLDPHHPSRKLELGPLRDRAELRWPVGPSIDAIVRGGSAEIPLIYVLRGRVAPKTHAELDQLVEHAPEAMTHPALVIGVGDQTAEGIKHYARGDRHAILRDNAPGDVTVCATDPEPTAAAICQMVAIPELRATAGHDPVVPVVIAR
jgi:tetratricopeptide (TPR) repeat protein